MNDFQLNGKVASIAGTVYGIGLETTRSLAETGATIVFNSLSPGSVEQSLESYRVAGIEAHDYVCDIADEEQIQAAIAQIKEEVGSIGTLVNNAGIIRQIPVMDVSAEEFRQVTGVDLNAPFIMVKTVIPDMIEKGHGKIINICSMMSELGHETANAYAAAKDGLKILTKNIVSECGQYNIQCNGIGPGYIGVPQMALLREPGHPFNEFILRQTPANRWSTPADLASLTVFLTSNASDFVSGHILYVDGGILAYIGKQP